MIPEVKQSRQLELIEVAVDALSSSSRRRREGVADMAFSEQRILPAKWVRKPSDCLVPCLASKLVINSTLLMAWEAMTVPADRTPLGREQSFHLLIGVVRKRGRRSRETQRVERAKAFDKEGESEAVYALRG